MKNGRFSIDINFKFLASFSQICQNRMICTQIALKRNFPLISNFP